MTAYRIDKKSDYTVVDNAFIKDSQLSFKAKGILLYLLSRPDGWEVYESDIAKQSSDGIRAVRSGIHELMEAGYISRQQKRDAKNRFAGYEYVVHEQLPSLRFAKAGNAKAGNGTLLNTDGSKYLNNQVRNNDNGLNQRFNRECVEFYDWYVSKCYPHYKKCAHPRLKKAQREAVLESLQSFVADSDVDLEGLGEMANQYFKTVKNCDHNINHFATEGIMQNRFYEVCY